MIQPFHFSFLLAEELEASAERMLSPIPAALAADPAISPILRMVARDRTALRKALTNTPGSSHTALIAQADEERDDAFVAFRGFCESAERRRAKPEHAAAGERLMRMIRAAGYSLQTLGNSTETGALNALFTALSSTAAVADLTKISATELLDELKTAQTTFETALSGRNTEDTESYPALAKARASLGNRLALLCGMINTLDELDSANTRPELDTLIARLNETITEILSPARARRSRGGNATVPATPVPPVS